MKKLLAVMLSAAALFGCPSNLDDVQDRLVDAYIILDEIEAEGGDVEEARSVVERLERIVARLREREGLAPLPEDNDEARKVLENERG